MKTYIATAAAALGLCSAVSPCWAASNRVWVSGHGVDQAGCGAPTAPCRSLQYAHDNAVAAGGEIDILDPAGYGSITITKAVSIVNDGVGTAGVQATGDNAITINAGDPDAVYLRGLTIDGLDASLFGVVANSGGRLTITNCTVRHFADYGVRIVPNGVKLAFVIADTIVADNGINGVVVAPKGAGADWRGTIDHLIATFNGINTNGAGVYINPTATAGSLEVTIAHSVLSQNGYGIIAETDGATPATNVAVFDTVADNNSDSGLIFIGTGAVRLRHSTLEGNQILGVDSRFATGTGAVYSYGDNSMAGNGADVFGPISSVTTR